MNKSTDDIWKNFGLGSSWRGDLTGEVSHPISRALKTIRNDLLFLDMTENGGTSSLNLGEGLKKVFFCL